MPKIKSIQHVGIKPVYNLYVEDTHNFLIQGNVISHNCDALRYFSIWWSHGANGEKKDEKVEWREDQWEDYDNASPQDKQLLIAKWGKPK